jgi:hypothetical protein
MTVLAAAAVDHTDNSTQLVIAALLGIAAVVALIVWLKVHPFVSLILGSAVLGVVAGVAPTDIITSFTTGLGSTTGSVGLLIALGAMIGGLLTHSGGADRIVTTIVGRVGPRALPWAMGGVAALIGIPLFFEIGVVLQRFERGELAVEQRRRHVVPRAVHDPVADQLGCRLDMGEPDRGVAVAEQVAVGALERRAGDDGVVPLRLVLADPGGQPAQPRPAVVVVERDARPHLLDVLRRVELVALGEVPAETGHELGGDGRLPGAGDAHDHDRRRARDGPLRHGSTLSPQLRAGDPSSTRL